MARRRTHASMVEGKNLPEKMSEKAARRFSSAVRIVTPVTAPAARRSDGCCGCESSAAVPSCVGRRGGKCVGREKGLPRSPIYRGGVVTAPVTTPPGSPAPWGFGGLRVAAQARVYAQHMEGYRIVCAACARDLRRQRDPAGIGLYPADPAKAPVHDLTTQETRISWLWQDSLPSVARFSGKSSRVCRLG